MTPRRVLLVALIAIMFIALIYGPLYSQYRDLRERNAKLTTELVSVRAGIAELRKEKYLLENDVHHMEKVLREELGLARPGEEIYRVKKTESTSASSAPVSND